MKQTNGYYHSERHRLPRKLKKALKPMRGWFDYSNCTFTIRRVDFRFLLVRTKWERKGVAYLKKQTLKSIQNGYLERMQERGLPITQEQIDEIKRKFKL